MDMLSPQTQLVFHNTTALDPADRMLDPDSCAVNVTIAFLFLWGQCATTRLFLRLHDHNTVESKTLKAHILIQRASWWKMVAFTISCPFIMTCSFPCFAQAPHAPMLIDDDDVLDCVIFLLTAIIPFLFFWVTWPIYRSLCSIVDKKGERCSEASPLNEGLPLPLPLVPPSFVEALSSANSMRISRLGRAPCCANARVRTGCNRWIHMFAFCNAPRNLDRQKC